MFHLQLCLSPHLILKHLRNFNVEDVPKLFIKFMGEAIGLGAMLPSKERRASLISISMKGLIRVLLSSINEL